MECSRNLVFMVNFRFMLDAVYPELPLVEVGILLFLHVFSPHFPFHFSEMDRIDSFLAKNINVAAVRKAYKIKDDEFRRFDMKDGVSMDFTRSVIARVSSKGISI